MDLTPRTVSGLLSGHLLLVSCPLPGKIIIWKKPPPLGLQMDLGLYPKNVLVPELCLLWEQTKLCQPQKATLGPRPRIVSVLSGGDQALPARSLEVEAVPLQPHFLKERESFSTIRS